MIFALGRNPYSSREDQRCQIPLRMFLLRLPRSTPEMDSKPLRMLHLTLIRLRRKLHPQNLSPMKNICSILGPNPLLWLWPNQATPGSGTRYKIAEGSDGEWIAFHRNDSSSDDRTAIQGGAKNLGVGLARNVEDAVEGIVGSVSGSGRERGRERKWTGADDEEGALARAETCECKSLGHYFIVIFI